MDRHSELQIGEQPFFVGEHKISVAQNTVGAAVQRNAGPGGFHQPKFNFASVAIPGAHGGACAIFFRLLAFHIPKASHKAWSFYHVRFAGGQNDKIQNGIRFVCPPGVGAYNEESRNLRILSRPLYGLCNKTIAEQ